MSYIPAARMPHAVAHSTPAPERVEFEGRRVPRRWLALGALGVGALAALVWSASR